MTWMTAQWKGAWAMATFWNHLQQHTSTSRPGCWPEEYSLLQIDARSEVPSTRFDQSMSLLVLCT